MNPVYEGMNIVSEDAVKPANHLSVNSVNTSQCRVVQYQLMATDTRTHLTLSGCSPLHDKHAASLCQGLVASGLVRTGCRSVSQEM
ncbi:hypothetical protein BaRGS_00018332 [Batillaria attramentaria]|uniref:Uncharacterized protein n=1 Tax=Batillaria attramentaria TaxID=370345 RepID=A0ABD0KTT1_9CAEN